MLKGIYSGDSAFLVQMSRTEARIAKANTQITSGIRVNQAQDDPFAIQSILGNQNQLDQLTQLQTNLNVSKNNATNADGALQTAGNILNQLVSLGAQGASDLTTPASRANLAIEAKQLAQQVIGISNTQIGSRYMFGGDTPSTMPYTQNWAVPGGATPATPTPQATALLRDSSGTTQQAGMTAQAIFDVRDSSGVPTTGNIFQAAYSLVTALENNDTTGTNAAVTALKAGVDHLANATVFYGNLETWIQTASDQASSQSASLTQTISSLRDTDLPTAITEMTSTQVSLQAALSAHATLTSKTLFDHLG